MRIREARASELLLRCPSEKDDVRTGGLQNSRIRTRGPFFLLGVRQKGSANLIQALVWNMETCRPDTQGEIQMGGPHKSESTVAGHRAGSSRQVHNPVGGSPIMSIARFGHVGIPRLGVGSKPGVAWGKRPRRIDYGEPDQILKRGIPRT